MASILLTLLTLTGSDAFPSMSARMAGKMPQSLRVPSKRSAITNNGGVLYPDAAHPFQAPSSTDIRGPCPGLNVLAYVYHRALRTIANAARNHGYIPRNGIASYDDLYNAMLDVYNIAPDFATFLATNAVVNDGDIVTELVSIGKADDAATAALGSAQSVLSSEGGLNSHNKFEGDVSLTRCDYYLCDGDNYSFNTSLFQQMESTVAETSSAADPIFDLAGLQVYRANRYQESLDTNPQFYAGSKLLFQYGAARFLDQIMPDYGNEGTPNRTIIDAFFGVDRDAEGNVIGSKPETFPPNWHNRPTPWNFLQVIEATLEIYQYDPKPFGGNAGVGNFIGIGENGLFLPSGEFNATPANLACLFYQIATDSVPDMLGGDVNADSGLLTYANSKLGGYPVIGCPTVAS